MDGGTYPSKEVRINWRQKMEAKDTVLRADAHYLCRKPLQDALLEQAKISFKSGKREGIREVVKWLKPRLYPRVILIDPTHPVLGYKLEVSEKEWQSQLKEWEVDKEVKDECIKGEDNL